MTRFGEGEWRYRQVALASDMQRLAARSQYLEQGAALQQPHHRGRGVQQVLEIVEHEQRAPLAQMLEEQILQGLRALGLQPQRPRYRLGQQIGVADRG